MLVEIEQRHIDESVSEDCAPGAIAIAISEMLKDDFQADVSVTDVSVYDIKNRRHIEPIIPLPRVANRWVRNHDIDPDSSKPFSFELDIPQELLRTT